MLEKFLYPSGLLPAAPVKHGYRNFWIRDGFYVGLCVPEVKSILWQGMIDILDRYRWKLEIHAKTPPTHWFEHIHVRYDECGKEIQNEHWLHNQFDAHANIGEVCLDAGRFDLAELLIDYLWTMRWSKKPAAGAWEDRNTCDAYSLAAGLHFLQRAKKILPHKYEQLNRMVRTGTRRLYSLLPFATVDKMVCLSLLGVVWPFDMSGPYKDEIIDSVKKNLMCEPFGFIRYIGDTYDGEGFSRKKGTELPWLLGDLFMAKIEPFNPIWNKRLKDAYDCFGCMPEAYFPETMKPNRNTPLMWAEAMYHDCTRDIS